MPGIGPKDQIKLYIDEDAMDTDLVAALRARDIPVVTAMDVGQIETADEKHLVYASEHGHVLYTYNVSDFYRLHAEWISAGRGHCGLILVPQQRFSVGEQLRRILHIRASLKLEEMRNRAEFLSNWG